MPPLPLSRRKRFRLARYVARLDNVVQTLDTIPDRKALLARAVVGPLRRTIGEGRALLGLRPNLALETSRRAADFAVETVLIWYRLAGLKPAPIKATRRNRKRTYPPPSAPW